MKRVNPAIEDGKMIYFNPFDLNYAFPEEYFITEVTFKYILNQIHEYHEFIGDLFYDPYEITENMVEHYKLKDLGEFLRWGSQTIKDKKIKIQLDGLKKKLDRLAMLTYDFIQRVAHH